MDAPAILTRAEPFFYAGNSVGCLVLHGFTGTPGEVRWLGQHLNAQGYTVYGPRLTGHGTHIKDMNRVSWRDWVLDTLGGYYLLREQCQRVFAIGLSMGGSLALGLASRQPVDGVVGLSSLHHLPRFGEPLTSMVNWLIPSIPKRHLKGREDTFTVRVKEEQARRGEEPVGHPSYPYYPVRALTEVYRLLRFVRAGLKDISVPTLLMHSRSDDLLSPDHVTAYDAEISGATDKQVIMLENSLHVITEDLEREIVFQAVADFVSAHC